MNGEEQPVAIGDDTPPIREQAVKRGWKCEFFDFAKADRPGTEFFNPGLVRRPDGLWLLVRRSEVTPGMWYGRNGIWACKLENDKKPLGGPTLKFPNSKVDEQFEDPRAVFWNNQTWIGCVNFTWFTTGSWTGAHQMIGVFQDKGGAEITEETWTPLARRDPIVGTNLGQAGHTGGKHNKNVLWWFIEGKLHCLYMSDPWNVVQFGSKWEDQIPYVAEGVQWKYGVVRGGTPPVRAGDFFYTFFHSSIPWRGRYRRYHMGAIAFETSPPFRPVFWTQEPILSGSQNDPWTQKKPLVVFPCGALLENEKWLITLGVNDLKSAWLEIPHADLLQLLKPIPVVPGLSLFSEVTATPEYPEIPYEEDLSGGVQESHVTHVDDSVTQVATSQNQSETGCSGSGSSDPPAQNISKYPYEKDFSRSTSLPEGDVDKITMAATVEEGTAPKLVQENASPNVRGDYSEDHKSGVTDGETSLLDKRRAALAKAREVLAAKRAAGLVVRKKKRKRGRPRKILKS